MNERGTRRPRRLAAAVTGALLLLAAVGVPIASASGPLELTESTTLAADYDGPIVIGADGITLDCAGHTVSGDGTGTGILLEGRTGVTVEDCRVTGFIRGFELAGASQNRLTRNTATGNGTAYGNGFYLRGGSNGNVLERNTSSDNGDPETDVEGFRVEDSRDNVLHDNVANGNATWGFILVGYEANATGNRLDGNTANDNAYIGFALNVGAVGNTFTGNTAAGNGSTGFDLCCGNGGSNTFRNNVAANNGGAGFAVSGSPGNTFVGNTANGNATGFVLDNTSGTRLSSNTADLNESDGFYAFHTTADVLSGNAARGNGKMLGGNGFVFITSSDLRLEKNTAQGSPWAGYAILGTTGSTFVGNSATGTSAGFQLEGWDGQPATGNTLRGNSANNNGFEGGLGNGFSLGIGASSNVLSGNMASGNNQGFLLWDPSATGNLLTSNLANRNTRFGFVVQGGPSGNTFIYDSAHANGEFDAYQEPDSGPNIWVNNNFGTSFGF